jgi:hypothetical protein
MGRKILLGVLLAVFLFVCVTDWDERLRIINEVFGYAERIYEPAQIFPTSAYAYFSGHSGKRANHPTIYAWGDDLTIIGEGYKRTYPMNFASDAFDEFLALVKRDG